MTKCCPACGLERLESVTETRSYAPPYGQPVEYQVAMMLCRACNESFEAEDTAQVVKQALKKANDASAKAMVEHLETKRFTMAYMERVLNLAPRTIARWKNQGQVSDPALALLRIVRTYPWILRVAGARFDSVVARRAVESEATNAKNYNHLVCQAANNNNQAETPVTISNVAA